MPTTIHPYLGVTKKKDYYTKAVNRCIKLNQRRFEIHFHKKNDRALIKWIEENKPYQAAIKRLIREEIKREKLRKKAEKKVK